MTLTDTPDDYRELLIGCGSNRQKKVFLPGDEQWRNLTTLDNNPAHAPDVLWDLNNLPLPFPDNYWNTISAYEVLEHLRKQGDYLGFFADFSEYWRLLKPGGLFCATVPRYNGMWAWGDPSHTRVICEGTLLFLSQAEYKKRVGITAMSDFRFCYKADFEIVHVEKDADSLIFILQAVK